MNDGGELDSFLHPESVCQDKSMFDLIKTKHQFG